MDNYELHMKTHTCHDDCQNPICVAVRKAVEAEREACAKECEEWQNSYEIDTKAWWTAGFCAASIRLRGKNGL